LPTNVNKTDSAPSSNSTNIWEGYFKRQKAKKLTKKVIRARRLLTKARMSLRFLIALKLWSFQTNKLVLLFKKLTLF